MTAIVDASVVIKWVMEEDGSEAARALVLDEPLAAPELLFIECANVLRTKVRSGDLSPDLARRAMASIDATPIRSILIKPYSPAAHAIAVELAISAYDALYLAVALAERAEMVTADARLARAASAHPVYAASVRLLA
jgi:predicted nucleic acid-binding protein